MYGFDYDEIHFWFGMGGFTKQYLSNKEPDAFEKKDGARWYFKNGMSQGGNPDFEDFDMEEAQMYYINRVVRYIDCKGGKAKDKEFNIEKDKPFFMYYAPHIPHWPHVPAKQFQGTTPMGYYGDFIAELDWAVGEISKALKRNNMLENTLIIFTSDNGAEQQSYSYNDKYNHYSSGNYRGVKRDLYEGGHRIPFIVSWPQKIKTASTSDRLISQTDIFVTLADYLNVKLPQNSAEDSYSFLDIMIPQEQVEAQRAIAIHQTGFSDKYALRNGDWLLINAVSGDNYHGKELAEPQWKKDRLGVLPHKQSVELFNLKEDPQQSKNLAGIYPQKTEELKALLLKYIKQGRTTKKRK